MNTRPKMLYLIRHGATDVQFNRKVNGSSDPPLNDTGRKQIQSLLTCLGKQQPKVIYTSPMARASQSAEILSSHFGCQTSEIPDLREIDMGDWDGLPLFEIKRKFPEEHEEWLLKPRNGESIELLCKRVGNILAIILDNNDNTGVIYCVTHAIRAILMAALDIPLKSYWKIKIPHGSVSCFEYIDHQLITNSIGQIAP